MVKSILRYLHARLRLANLIWEPTILDPNYLTDAEASEAQADATRWLATEPILRISQTECQRRLELARQGRTAELWGR